MPQPETTTWKAAALCGGVFACAWLLAEWLGVDGAPPPFAWSDVALVALLSTLPVAALMAERVRALAPRPVTLAMVVGTVVIGWLSLATEPPPAVPAALFSFAAALSVLTWLPASCRSPRPVLAWLLALACAAALPWVYIEARCRADSARLVELAQQSRLGEAQNLAKRLLLLQPRAVIEGHPLSEIIAQNQLTLDELEQRVAPALSPDASADERLARARDLAMLGHTDEALATLGSSPDLAADARHLRGTIHAARGEYGSALTEFTAARRARLSSGTGPDLVDATCQLALCQRKLGRYADAERTYQELLTLAPTAETHFLLAQFYEDAQQTRPAQMHAQLAAELDPARYGMPSRQLQSRLITHHFGCWSAWSAQE